MCVETNQEVHTPPTDEKHGGRTTTLMDIPVGVVYVLVHSRVFIPNVLIAVAILKAMEGNYILDLNTAADEEVSLGLSAGEYFAYAVQPDVSEELAVPWLVRRSAQLKKDIEEDLRLAEWIGRLL